MRSGVQLTVVGIFLACVAAFILYLLLAPDYEPAPAPPAPLQQAIKPIPVKSDPPTPLPAPLPEPEPEPDPQPQPQPEPPQPRPEPEPESLGDYGSIEGTVTRVTVPVPRARVTALPDAASGETAGLTTTTDQRGQFKLPRVPAGRVQVSVTESGVIDEARLTVMVNKDQTARVDFRLPEGTGKIEGFVYAGGVALPATVEITMTGESMEQTRKIDAPNGSFVADGLLPGVLNLMVTVDYPPGERKTKSDSFGLMPGEVVRKEYSFSLPALITGQVSGIDQDERTIVVAMYGELQPNETFQTPQEVADRLAKMVRVDEAGEFRIEGLEPGAYTLMAFSMRTTDDNGEAIPVFKTDSQVVEIVEESLIEGIHLNIKW